MLGWGGGIRPAFRWRESQSNEHSSFVTFPCGLPLAILTPNVLGSAESFGSSNRPHPQDIENVPDHKDLGHFLWLGLGDGNITFSDELDFDVAELDIVYEDNDEEASQ